MKWRNSIDFSDSIDTIRTIEMSEIKSIQILLDVDLWARVRARSALLKRSAQECASEALRVWLAREGSEVVPMGSVVEKNEKGARAVDVNAAVVVPLDPTKPARLSARSPEAVCQRCGEMWKNHQEGSRQCRAGRTGCTTFLDPPSAEGAF